ncbi:hypothetical protein ABDJ85_15270 [Roseateles sp. DJS-2-20]|uniref:4Fe-4S ferredoxin-type domain-containing protein n=1 Tax=Roseateles paludis TaxID=3145238 RepID=A0ABV0G547_9BURK
MNQVIRIHPDAPHKPAEGSPCNGCGVCCAAEPCPLGVLLSRKRQGACVALTWTGERYVCGALRGGRLRRWLVGRWIGAGRGCDCSLEASPSSLSGEESR